MFYNESFIECIFFLFGSQLIENIQRDFIIGALALYGLVMKQDQNTFLKSGVRGMQMESQIIAVIVCICRLQEVTSGGIQAVEGIKVFCVKPMKLFVMAMVIRTIKVMTGVNAQSGKIPLFFF